jgi:hypothetical protein
MSNITLRVALPEASEWRPSRNLREEIQTCAKEYDDLIKLAHGKERKKTLLTKSLPKSIRTNRKLYISNACREYSKSRTDILEQTFDEILKNSDDKLHKVVIDTLDLEIEALNSKRDNYIRDVCDRYLKPYLKRAEELDKGCSFEVARYALDQTRKIRPEDDPPRDILNLAKQARSLVCYIFQALTKRKELTELQLVEKKISLEEKEAAKQRAVSLEENTPSNKLVAEVVLDALKPIKEEMKKMAKNLQGRGNKGAPVKQNQKSLKSKASANKTKPSLVQANQKGKDPAGQGKGRTVNSFPKRGGRSGGGRGSFSKRGRGGRSGPKRGRGY